MHITAKHLRICGRVQGVGYRAWMVATARQLGVHGWVRNRRDDSVEAVISGNAAQLETLIHACHEGPPAARVDSVEITDHPSPQPQQGFVSQPTA